MKNLISGLVVAISGFGIATHVTAQELEQKCLDQVTTICGSMDADECFRDAVKWNQISSNCTSDVQSLVEMAKEAKAAMALEGGSWGGKVRNGPGTNHQQIGSLVEGDLVLLEENTGVMLNGHPWFRISHYNSKTGKSLNGFQWGGILCSFDARQGVFKQCPIEWSDNPARQKQAGIAEDNIAPIHGNSDEDNEEIDAQNMINTCLKEQADMGNNGLLCIGKYSGNCLEKDSSVSTVAMRECVNMESRIWDNKLNESYQSVLASLDTDDKKVSLRNAQRLWIKFVDSFCPLAYEFHQGSLYLLSGDQCMMEMKAQQYFKIKVLSANPEGN